MIKSKVCSWCKVNKLVTEFYELRPGQPRSYCKQCDKDKALKWTSENIERKREIRRNHYYRNKDTVRIEQRAYYLKNKDKIVERERNRRHQNPRLYAMKKRAIVWKKFGASYELFDKLIKLQENKCDICGDEFNEKNKPQFDHNHLTMKARGLLCVACNTNLPYIEDEDFLQKAKLYLLKYNDTKDKEPLL